MKNDGYDDLPDGMSSLDVVRLLEEFFLEEPWIGLREKYGKLDVIADKQWHTYEVPQQATRERIRNWLIFNWQENPEFLDLALGLCYCFGLDKNLFSRAFKGYAGEQYWEYKEMLEKSVGENIDPYFSLKK